MANTFRYSCNVIAVLAIPIYVIAGALLTAIALQTTVVQTIERSGTFDEIEISPTVGWVTASLVACLLMLAAASQTVKPTWRQLAEWGRKADTRFGEWKDGRKYYLVPERKPLKPFFYRHFSPI